MYAEVAAKYPEYTLKITPNCSSHSSTALYEAYKASQEETGCVRWQLVIPVGQGPTRSLFKGTINDPKFQISLFSKPLGFFAYSERPSL